MVQYDTSVGYIVVNDKGHFLLLQKANDGTWDFPKGHFNAGEVDERAVARREFEEETGLNHSLLKPFDGFRHEHTFVNAFGLHRKIILFMGLCNEEPTLSSEHMMYFWVPLEKAKDLMRFKEKQEALDEAALFLRNKLKK